MRISDVLDEFAPDREFYRRQENGQQHYNVLDHGYLEVMESWGSDERIVETARMSTDKGFLGWDPGPCPACGGSGGVFVDEGFPPAECRSCSGKGRVPGDAKLLKYLYENKHSTPFEFAGLTLEVQAPLFVFREWHRHRTQSYSEMSARYVQMPDLHYVPSVERIIASTKKGANKQASGSGELRIPGEHLDEYGTAMAVQALIRTEQARIYRLYEGLISFGVAKEVARIDTPVSRYSRMRATGNLRNWLAFLTLRMAPNAQFEIRQYAWCVADAIATTYPRTYELFFKDMLPALEPELAPKKLLADSLDVLLSGSDSDFTDFVGVARFERIAPLISRLRKALGRPS